MGGLCVTLNVIKVIDVFASKVLITQNLTQWKIDADGS